MQTITAYEGRPVILPENYNHGAILSRLTKLSKKYHLPIFLFENGKIKSSGVVGTVSQGNLRIEILPKTTNASTKEEDRYFLLNLLRAAGYVRDLGIMPGLSKSARVDFLEIIITEVTNEIVAGLGDGVPRRYAQCEEDIPTIRGKIKFNKMVRKVQNSSHFISVQYNQLMNDNKLSRVLKWTVTKLFHITHSIKNRELLAACRERFASVKDCSCTFHHIESLKLSRLESRWVRTLEVSKMLANSLAIDPTRSGKSDSFSLVMPVNYLFERALRTLLSSALKNNSYNVTCHTEKLYILQDCLTGLPSMRLRPDFIFKTSEGKTFAVADAKWKLLQPSNESHGLSPSDIYQVIAYLRQYQVDIGILIFPMTDWMLESVKDTWVKWYRVPGSSCLICLLAIDLNKLLSQAKAIRNEALKTLGECIDKILNYS